MLLNHYNFHVRVQEVGESLSDFVAALRRLSSDCDFRNLDEVIIRDRFVAGIADNQVRSRVLSNACNLENDSLEKVVRLAESIVSQSVDDKDCLEFLRLNEIKFQCQICNAKYSFEADLLKHMKVKHNQEHDCKCNICSETFTSKHGLNLHQSLKHPNQKENCPTKEFPCDMCSKKCASESGLNLHQSKIHKKTKKLAFSCTLCPKNFSLKFDLSKHYRRCHQNAFSGKKCSECDEVFSTARGLQVHEGMAHKIKSCVDCKQPFPNAELLQDHLKTSHPELNQLACEHCDRIFTDHVALVTHVKTVHEAEDGLCDICGKTFKDPKEHARNIHPTTKPYQCIDCDFSHGTERGLKRHIKSQHSELSFDCDACEFKTTANWKLDQHKKIVHEKMRPFTCTLCNKSFATRSYVNHHIKGKISS